MNYDIATRTKQNTNGGGGNTMTRTEIKTKIAEIDALLDSDISDSEFSRLEAEAASLTAELGNLESAEQLRAVKTLNKVNDWTNSFLSSFDNGTRIITNRQADCFRRINGGRPFIFGGRRYDCTGANYRAGFGTLVVTNIGNNIQK